MNLKHKLNIFAFVVIASSATAFVPPAEAQQRENRQPPASLTKPADAAIGDDDISITASVTARQLKFEAVPNPSVEFPGKPERANVWEADRRNLPRPVEPGVTYRNIGVELRIASRFADIERIVAEALGEISVSDAAPTDQTPAAAELKAPAPVNQSSQNSRNSRNKKR